MKRQSRPPQEGLNSMSKIGKRYRAIFCRTCGFAMFGLGVFLISGCGAAPPAVIQFTLVPEGGPGGAAKTVRIAGRVTGSKSGQRIVLFARAIRFAAMLPEASIAKTNKVPCLCFSNL